VVDLRPLLDFGFLRLDEIPDPRLAANFGARPDARKWSDLRAFGNLRAFEMRESLDENLLGHDEFETIDAGSPARRGAFRISKVCSAAFSTTNTPRRSPLPKRKTRHLNTELQHRHIENRLQARENN